MVTNLQKLFHCTPTDKLYRAKLLLHIYLLRIVCFHIESSHRDCRSFETRSKFDNFDIQIKAYSTLLLLHHLLKMESEVPTANGENSTASANTSDVIIDMDVDIVNDEEEVIPESQPILDDDGEEVPDEDFEEMDDNFLAGIAQLERESLSSSSKDKKEDEEIRRKKQVQELPRLSPSERIFPDLRPSNFHTVAFEMKVKKMIRRKGMEYKY